MFTLWFQRPLTVSSTDFTGPEHPSVAVNSSAVKGLPRPVPEIKFWGIASELHTASEKAREGGALVCLLLASRLGI